MYIVTKQIARIGHPNFNRLEFFDKLLILTTIIVKSLVILFC